jgi:carbonic anhydrase/acetyltransferase-like protein (isoleucine patch superfamily)
LPLIEIHGKWPEIASDCFVADSATLAGDIRLSDRSSVWFGASIRAEFEMVLIGSRSNIQDNCTIHTDEGFPCILGERVSVGHGAVVHGAQIGSNCLIGMGSIILNGAKIGKNSMVGAGTLILQGAEIPERTLVLGSPAKTVRTVTDDEIEKIAINAKHYDEFRATYLSSKHR